MCTEFLVLFGCIVKRRRIYIDNTHSGPRPSNVALTHSYAARSRFACIYQYTAPQIIARNEHTTNSGNLYNIAISIHVFLTKFLVFFLLLLLFSLCTFFFTVCFSFYLSIFPANSNFSIHYIFFFGVFVATRWIVSFNDFSE